MNTAQRTELLNDKLTTAETLAQNAQLSIYPAGKERDIHTIFEVRRLIETAESAQRTAVQAARANGATWEQIAIALGVTRQAAQQRYGG